MPAGSSPAIEPRNHRTITLLRIDRLLGVLHQETDMHPVTRRCAIYARVSGHRQRTDGDQGRKAPQEESTGFLHKRVQDCAAQSPEHGQDGQVALRADQYSVSCVVPADRSSQVSCLTRAHLREQVQKHPCSPIEMFSLERHSVLASMATRAAVSVPMCLDP